MQTKLDPKDARRPLYYENFEGRVRSFCQRGVNDEFELRELQAIVYDYLNVVYRGIWKADDRFALYEQTLNKLNEENDCLSVQLNYEIGRIEKLEQTTCFKINQFLNKLKTYLTWSKHNE